MGKSRNHQGHKQDIYKVQDYICTHLDQELNLAKLAKIAAFSPFHFHRLFKTVAGETLNSFIQRTRLEKACAMLSSKSDMKIIYIAASCGFSTPSSFSKSFKKHFNISPSEYRDSHSHNNFNSAPQKSKNGTPKSNIDKETVTPTEYISDSELTELISRRKEMNVKIEKLPEYRIAYMRKIGPYGNNNIQLMQELKKWAITRDLLVESSIILGIAHDDPQVTPVENCRYDSCVVLSDEYELEKNINEAVLPGGEYAIFSTEYTAEAVAQTWNEIFSIWLPDSTYQIDERPVFERYIGASTDINIQPETCEICIPVKRL